MSNTEERGIRIRNAEEIIFPAEPQQELTMGSLFDGIGGFPLAAKNSWKEKLLSRALIRARRDTV